MIRIGVLGAAKIAPKAIIDPAAKRGDCKVSAVACRDGARGDRISLATWVHTHNRLGRAYLKLILPFHVLIVRSRLAALARHFAP